MKLSAAALVPVFLIPCLLPAQAADLPEAPSFNRDIRPILASHCFACHGPDDSHREADLRLDRRDDAIQAGVLVPGHADESELIRRILSRDPDEQMPPPTAREQLSDLQKQLLRRWVAGGAEYEPHWAFIPPVRHEPPATAFETRVRNDIDRFIFARLETEGLTPSPEADPYTLVRRVYLDLTGLPPTPEEADAFVSNTDPDAYGKLVDRLLNSPRYGERWARVWLDLARYADTNGYEKDRPRSIWPYRDWVIRALNADMPYDRFSIEQLAGDMLPDATLDQRIATGFHRNTMLNEEGGIDPLEYRFYALVDRVATTGTIWLGLTVKCAQCHTHKYDPIQHSEYYGLLALLNNADEPDLILPDPDITQRRMEILARIDQLEDRLPDAFPADSDESSAKAVPSDEEQPDASLPDADQRRKSFDLAFEKWLQDQRASAVPWDVVRPTELKSNLPRLEVLEDGSVFSSGDITKRDLLTLAFEIREEQLPITALRLEALPDSRLPAGGPGRAYYEGRKGDFFLSEVTASMNSSTLAFATASHSYGKISIGSGDARAENVIDGDGSTGWSTAGREGEAHQLVLVLKEPVSSAGRLTINLLFERHFAASLGRFRISTTAASGSPRATTLPVALEAVLAQSGKLPASTRAALRRHFARTTPELAEARKAIDALRRSLPELPHTLVMQARPADHQRETFRHHRGEYLSPRERVAPGIPEFLRRGSRQPADRLAFARWLVSEQNPLAARVAVNRFWQAFFGTGLVVSADDFGTQSAPPSHPKLLDWLATEFVARGWSQKSLHRLIVTSATYRQASHVTPRLLEQDPNNRLIARGSRFRLPAESIRDIMLKASGLLSSKMYGPGVYPPQPASVTGLAYGSTAWPVSTGVDRYRRSIYTFIKRTAPFAAYTVFDAPTGERCVARRNRSNTPLQALTLLNDDMFLEMARALARDVLNEPRAAEHRPPDSAETATRIFRRLLIRPPTPAELTAILDYHRSQTHRLQTGRLDARGILAASGSSDEDVPDRMIQQAGWVMVARVLMNLDETVSHQ